MKTRLALAIVTGGVLLASVPASAHHSFAAEFDSANCKDFAGTLTKVDWQNPHAYFYLDVMTRAGRPSPGPFKPPPSSR